MTEKRKSRKTDKVQFPGPFPQTKTTVKIDSELHRRIRIIAIESGRTFQHTVQDALNEYQKKYPGSNW